MKHYSIHLLILLFLGIRVVSHAQRVHVVTLDATINPATAEYLHESIHRAAEANAECLIIRLNTPGGLLKSTRVIVTDLLTAPIPVIVYVAPSGSQSASAGTFITLAAHIAAMAPGTNIGAAHPVGMQGGEKDSIMNEKATNDAAAFIRSISEKRKRNVQWAEQAVRQSYSITETEALKDSVIDIIVPSVKELLEKVDGWTVELEGHSKTLHTKNAEVENFDMDWKHRILDILSDPNIAYIFFLLGIYGLLFELYNPGTILPGVVGVISIFIAEIKIASYGLLTVGGVISLLLGSIMLINPESSLEVISISWSVIIPAALFTAAFFIFAIGMGIRAQRRKPVTGIEGIVGEVGEAFSDLTPDGQVQVHGEIWNATSAEGKLKKGTPIRVDQVKNLHLTVRKAAP